MNAEGTAKRYERIVKDFLSFLGPRSDVDLCHITPKDIEGFRDEESKAGKAASSVNIAKRQGMIATNPAEGVKLLPSDGEERVPFTADQLLSLIKTADFEWKGMILLGYYTGARLDVCARMKWACVDFEAGLLKFQPNKVRRGTKVKLIICPIHPELAAYLRSLPGSKHPGAPVLAYLSKRRTSGKTGLSETFQDLMATAGIEVPKGREKTGKGRQFRKLGFHSLRHTFNSDLANAGIGQEIRMELTGHASESVNSIYTHLDIAPLAGAIAKLSWIGGTTAAA